MNHDMVGVIIMSVMCGTGMVITLASLLYCYLTNPRRLKADPALHEEIRALREEVTQLRRQNHDVILSFDQTMQRLEQRMDHVEDRVLPVVTASAESQAQLVGRQY